MSGPMLRQALARYEYYNSTHPIAIRGTLGIGLFFISDVLAQRAEHRAQPPAPDPASGSCSVVHTPLEPFGLKQWDSARSVRTCTWRAVIWAPIAHCFWLGLETHVSPAVAHLGHRGTVLKIAIDFATISPILVYSFLYWSKIWEGGDHRGTIAHANARVGPTLLATYSFWTPLHIFTYGVVPLRHRVAWVSLCSLGYGSLLSFMNAQ